MHRNTLRLLLIALTAAFFGAVQAEPPTERLELLAVADDDQPRILLRWRSIEGVKRYDFYDVMRRGADEASLMLQNLDPIGPMESVVEIQAAFTAPGREDALQWIQQTLGADYASQLLMLQLPGAADVADAQLRYLPEQNYVAAMALGLGYLDENVVAGETYVYELWGLDGAGAPAERLGRATATALSPEVLGAPGNVACVDPGDVRGHGAAFVRWTGSGDESRSFGYEMLRLPANPDGTCPPMNPSTPGVVRASEFPVLSPSPGRQKLGSALMQQTCIACHAGGRDDPSVAGKTLRDFRRRQIGDAADPSTPHDTPQLNAMTPDELDAVFEHVQAFNFRDDGDDTPNDPVQLREKYCYQAIPRNLFGDLGSPSPPIACEILDRDVPDQPANIASKRVLQVDYEVCEISWSRNDESLDETQSYEIYRQPGVPRDVNVDRLPASWQVGTVLQQDVPVGNRAIFLDNSITVAEAGKTFFYAARALDVSGNPSPLSPWVPCVPRDVRAPRDSQVSIDCCEENPGNICDDKRFDERWLQEGGLQTLRTDQTCPPRISFTKPDDTWAVRTFRSFDGVTYLSGPDVTQSPYIPTFVPMIDSKVCHQFQTIDQSGNLGPMSLASCFLMFGKVPLPAPKITKVLLDLQDDGDNKDWIRIQFRSLSPKALVGFELYASYLQQGQEDPDPSDPLFYIDDFPDQNLGNPPTPPDDWVVLAGAVSLDNILTDVEPASGRFLTYDPTTSVYEMKVKVGEASNVVLHLRAIGWSGIPGNVKPYFWDGFGNGDLVLDWPLWRKRNFRNQPVSWADLTLTPIGNEIELSWGTEPTGCAQTTARPFVVYRRRGSSTRWQQVSPVLTCVNAIDTVLKWRDTDTEVDTWYSYVVVRYDRYGEFLHQYGEAQICNMPAGPTCSAPQP